MLLPPVHRLKEKEDKAAPPPPSFLDVRDVKVAKWLRHQPPPRILSLRKRRNKLKLATLNARFTTELGEAANSEGKGHISPILPLDVHPDHGSLGILYHEVGTVPRDC